MVMRCLNSSILVTSCYFICSHAGGSRTIRPICSYAAMMFLFPSMSKCRANGNMDRSVCLFTARSNMWARCHGEAAEKAQKLKELLKITLPS